MAEMVRGSDAGATTAMIGGGTRGRGTGTGRGDGIETGVLGTGTGSETEGRGSIGIGSKNVIHGEGIGNDQDRQCFDEPL